MEPYRMSYAKPQDLWRHVQWRVTNLPDLRLVQASPARSVPKCSCPQSPVFGTYV